MLLFCIDKSISPFLFFFFFFNDTATTEIYTLSLHDALPISRPWAASTCRASVAWTAPSARSEEHTSELQSPVHLVCRLLLEKKKTQTMTFLFLKARKEQHEERYELTSA